MTGCEWYRLEVVCCDIPSARSKKGASMGVAGPAEMEGDHKEKGSMCALSPRPPRSGGVSERYAVDGDGGL